MPINLLPRKEKSLADRFFSWILTYGRFIIIGTELIVLVAFLSRFKLDRDLVDLHDKIKREEAVVKSLSIVESQSINLQRRLSFISTLDSKIKNSTDTLTNIPSLVPENVFLDELALSKNDLRLIANTYSGEGITNLVKRLGEVSYISEISLDRVTKDETTGIISFIIRAKLAYGNINR